MCTAVQRAADDAPRDDAPRDDAPETIPELTPGSHSADFSVYINFCPFGNGGRLDEGDISPGFDLGPVGL